MAELNGSSKSPIQPPPNRWAWIVLGVAALAITVMAYLPSLKAGFYFDDLNNIVELPAIHWNEVSLEGLRQVASAAHLPDRVVANVTFALNHVFGGLDPTGYHVVNLLIHLMVGVALMWVCFEYTIANNRNRIGASNTAICSVAAATLFLVHPLNTQAVTYIVQRMASMAALFVLVSFGCYLHARRAASSRRRVVFLLLALLAWVLGILSKETAVVLPAVVLAYELVFHGKEWRGRAASALADPRRRFVAIGLFAAGVAGGILLVGLYIDYSTFSILKQYPNRDFNGLERVLTQFRVQIFYLFLFLWPAPSRLSLEHDFAVSTSILQPPVTLIAILFWVACVALAARLLIRRPRIGFPLLAYVMFHAIESAPLNLERRCSSNQIQSGGGAFWLWYPSSRSFSRSPPIRETWCGLIPFDFTPTACPRRRTNSALSTIWARISAEPVGSTRRRRSSQGPWRSNQPTR
jgi:hypothetical protein